MKTTAKELEDLLASVFLATVNELLTRIESGEASPAELNVAAKILKDNDITIASLDKQSPLADLFDHVTALDEGEASTYFN